MFIVTNCLEFVNHFIFQPKKSLCWKPAVFSTSKLNFSPHSVTQSSQFSIWTLFFVEKAPRCWNLCWKYYTNIWKSLEYYRRNLRMNFFSTPFSFQQRMVKDFYRGRKNIISLIGLIKKRGTTAFGKHCNSSLEPTYWWCS